jgi:hypothetical protein
MLDHSVYLSFKSEQEQSPADPYCINAQTEILVDARWTHKNQVLNPYGSLL